MMKIRLFRMPIERGSELRSLSARLRYPRDMAGEEERLVVLNCLELFFAVVAVDEACQRERAGRALSQRFS